MNSRSSVWAHLVHVHFRMTKATRDEDLFHDDEPFIEDLAPATTRAIPVSTIRPVAAERERESIAELPIHPLGELDLPLTMRVLRLEMRNEARGVTDDPFLLATRNLRALLVRACGYAAGASGEAPSLESALAEALRALYAWAFRAIDAAEAGNIPRSAPGRVDTALFELIDACEGRLQIDPGLERLREILVELREVASSLPRAHEAAVAAS